ncbi:suppressor of fused domain protein [Streptomyces glaucus]|uniref:Suppressor of fused-like domain-containing protein n=1 Tax=Streptomyces glaucus TaxID=284029 RepID=A0ABN3K087_9ACTN
MTDLPSSPAEFFIREWGEPLREASFRTRDGHDIRILKWVGGEGEDGLTFYRTSGACDVPVPGADGKHRQEFFLSRGPGCDDIAESIAQAGIYAARSGRALAARNIYRAPGPLWPGTGLAGFVVTDPFEGEATSTVLADGRHVEFLMLVPAFPAELDYASRHGTGALADAQERAGVHFRDPYRKPVSPTASRRESGRSG